MPNISSRIIAAGHRYTAVPAGLAPLLLVWLASFTGLFELPNALLYDGLYSLQTATEQRSRVLMVEVDPAAKAGDDSMWTRFMDQVLGSGANPIVFSFLPDDAPREFFDKASAAGVIFGRKPIANADEPGGGHWQSPPAAAAHLPLQLGLLPPPEQIHGVYRSHWLRPARFGEAGESPWLLAARQANSTNLPDTATFNLNLRGGSAHLFRLTASQALDGGLVPELTAGRVLLVSLGNPEGFGLFTPVGLMSAPVYEGLALDTLLGGQAVSEGGLGWSILTSSLAMVICLIVFQAVPALADVWFALGLGVAYTAGAWASLQFAAFWPPLAEILTTHVLASILLSRHRLRQEETRLRGLIADLDTKLAERVSPESFYQAEDHWAYIATLVQQYFNLHRTIFLERMPRNHRLREIKAIGCSLQDIDERRRDFDRAPYSTAIAERAPIRLDGTYLKNSMADESQYLVPLIFAGEVLGFWVLTVRSGDATETPELLSLVGNVAEQLSQLLHYRSRWRERDTTLRSTVRAYLRLEGATEPSHGLRASVALLKQRLNRLQDMFDVLPTYCSLYDLFGRLLLVNHRMESLARQLAIRPYDKTVSELIAELTGHPLQQVHDWLQYVILRNGEITLPVPLPDKRFFLLNMKPMRRNGHAHHAATGEDSSQPKDVYGVLLALKDVTRFKNVDDVKNDTLQRGLVRLQGELTAFQRGLDLLAGGKLPEPEREHALATLRNELEGMKPRLTEMQNQLSAGWDKFLDESLARYPVDGLEPLRDVLAELGDEGIRPDVRVEVSCPERLSLVLAVPDQLRFLFDTVLRLLFDDTRPNGRLTIAVEDSAGRVRYRFADTGLGVSPDSLQSSLQHPTATGDAFADLRQAIKVATHWGGELTASSELGAGLRFALTLQPFRAPAGQVAPQEGGNSRVATAS